MVELVDVIIIIKGHCATHLKVVGLLTPFAALPVWQSATSLSSQYLYPWKLSLAGLVAYVMLKQRNIILYNQKFGMNSKPWFTLGLLFKSCSRQSFVSSYISFISLPWYHTLWIFTDSSTRQHQKHALIDSHLQLAEEAALWQLQGLYKRCKVKDNKGKKVLS